MCYYASLKVLTVRWKEVAKVFGTLLYPHTNSSVLAATGPIVHMVGIANEKRKKE